MLCPNPGKDTAFLCPDADYKHAIAVALMYKADGKS
jgi:hypothetical protein